jgi:hypothetical protein
MLIRQMPPALAHSIRGLRGWREPEPTRGGSETVVGHKTVVDLTRMFDSSLMRGLTGKSDRGRL